MNGKIIAQIVGTDKEKEILKKVAKAANLSLSNYLRQLSGLPLNETFAPEGNKRAAGNKGRWLPLGQAGFWELFKSLMEKTSVDYGFILAQTYPKGEKEIWFECGQISHITLYFGTRNGYYNTEVFNNTFIDDFYKKGVNKAEELLEADLRKAIDDYLKDN